MPRFATARRTAALAAAVGLALAATGCGAGTEQSAAGSTTDDTTTGGTASPGPSSAATGGPTDLPTFDPSSAVATYAQGFPPELFPMPDDATLLASSAQPVPAAAGSKGSKTKGVPMTQVTLNLSSSRPTDQVIKQAEKILTAQGFRRIDAPDASGLTAQTAFLRITKEKSGEVQESLVVGVLDDGERRLGSISGTVRTP
ncbi:hypothetical protein ACFWEJ_10690 [Promicromonospora sp. NPDC060204]|uniref:hypothetical protein n=1 Tax=Promicromonospora sp. NPDC060204 TaxID=3347071 RepID=UPI0036684407